MRRPEFIAEQSRRPSGALGWLIGSIMSHETESLNAATLASLELRPGGRLALGFRTKDDGSGAEAFPDAVYRFYGVEVVRDLLRAGGFQGEIVEATAGAGSGMVVLVAALGMAR